MRQISSPNNSVLVIGRILVYSDSDLPTAYDLAKQIRLTSQGKRKFFFIPANTSAWCEQTSRKRISLIAIERNSAYILEP